MRLHLAIVVTILTAASAWAASGGKHRFPPEQIPGFAIPRIATPPTLDGTIDPAEWHEAVRLTGVARVGGNSFYGRPHAFYVAWDPEHLYLAGRTHILPGHVLQKTRREPYTTGVVFDDAFEFGIDLLGRNKAPGEEDSYYKWILNFLGAGEYMKNYPKIGQYMYNWRPTMHPASRLVQTDEGTFWEIEMALDLDDLELPTPFAAGQQFRLLLGTDLKNPGWEWACVPSSTNYLESFGYPLATLVEGRPYVQVERLDGLHDEALHLRAVICNPTDQPVAVQTLVQVRNEGTEAKEAVRKVVFDSQDTLTIPARGSQRLDADATFPGLSYDQDKRAGTAMQGAFELLVTQPDQPAAAPVYKYFLSFARDAEKKYLQYTPHPVAFAATVEYNPARNTLLVSGDTLDAQVPEGSRIAGLRYDVSLAGANIAGGTITQYVYYKYEQLLDLPALAAGEYVVALSLVDATGKALATRDDLAFAKKDEAKVFAKWWRNDIGRPERVIPPFEPIALTGGWLRPTRAAVTRRTYTWDRLGLPQAIEANGGAVLTGPARIVVTVAGHDVVVPGGGRPEIVEECPWRVRFTGEAEAAGLRFRVAGWLEQDGLVNLDLTYAPTGAPVAIQELRVEWPIDDTLGNHMAVIGNGGNYTARFIDRVPDGRGEVWNTLDDIGLSGSAMTVGNFYRNVWIGNEFRGLLWAGHSDAGWVPSDRLPSHSIVRRGGSVILRNHLVGTYPGDTPFTLTGPRTVNLKYMASPFRKLTKGWRLNQVSAANGFSEKPKYKYNWDTGKQYFSVLSPPFADTDRWPEYYAHCKFVAEERSRAGIYSVRPRLRGYLTNQIALRGYMDKTLEPGLYDYFRGDWMTSDAGEALSKSYTDYMIWLQDRQVREGGCTHFYYDISFSRPAKGYSTGIGYRLPDGRIQPASLDENLRHWYQRVRAMMDAAGQEPGGISGHATQSICLLALPWADAVLDSEFAMKDPVTVYPMHRMIAMSVPEAFGVNVNHLGQMNPDWAIMHDAGQGSDGGYFNDEAFRHWGIGREDVQFVGYWRNSQYVRRLGDGLLCSIWRRPNSVVLGILNYGLDAEGHEKVRPAELTLDLDALGVPAGARGERLRVQPFLNPPLRRRYQGCYAFYEQYPAAEVNDKYKPLPEFTATIDPTTGAVTGFDIQYHCLRAVAVYWEDGPVDDTEWGDLFPGDLRAKVLDWGVNLPGTATVPAADVVQADGADTHARIWRRNGTILCRASNIGDTARTVCLTLDLAALGVKVDDLWTQFTGLVNLDGRGTREIVGDETNPIVRQREIAAGTIYFNGHTGEVWLQLDPGQSRAFTIDTF